MNTTTLNTAKNPIKQKTATLIKGIGIAMNRDYNYGVFKPKRDGIEVEFTNHPPKKGFVMLREASSCSLTIPRRIRIAYELESRVLVEIQDSTHVFIRKDCKYAELPHAYSGFSFQGNLAPVPIDLSLESGQVILNMACTIQTGDIIPKEWKYRKIRIHTGDCIRIEVSELDKYQSRRKIIEDRDLKDEFGVRMQWYAGNTITYYTHCKTGPALRLITCPKFFRTASHMQIGDTFNWYKVEQDGKPIFVFAPGETSCDFTKEPIVPAEGVPETVRICEDCKDEQDDIGALMASLRDMQQLMLKVTESYEECRKENAVMKKRLNLLISVLGGDLDE